jgi:alpha-D-ribose 1-methylphosphonate 5-triphosphate synthase subunit PhnG
MGNGNTHFNKGNQTMTMTTLRLQIEADSHGVDFRQDLRSELEIIDRLIKDLQAHKTARRELAVESGYAEFKEVTVKEHIRKEHIQNRFAWIR